MSGKTWIDLSTSVAQVPQETRVTPKPPVAQVPPVAFDAPLTFASDVDGVCLDYVGLFNAAARGLGLQGAQQLETPTRWDFVGGCPQREQVAEWLFCTFSYWRYQEAIPEALGVFQELGDHGGPRKPQGPQLVAYISSRDFDTSITRDTLVGHGFPDAPVYHGSWKFDITRELGVDFLLEDKPQTALSALENGETPVLLVETPYSGHHPRDEELTPGAVYRLGCREYRVILDVLTLPVEKLPGLTREDLRLRWVTAQTMLAFFKGVQLG